MININATLPEALKALNDEYGIDLDLPRSLRCEAINTMIILAGNGAQLYMPVAHDRAIVIDCHGVVLTISLDVRNHIVINAIEPWSGAPVWRKVYLKTAICLFGNYVGVRKARAFSAPMR